MKSFISNSTEKKKSKLKKNSTDIDVTDNKYLYERAKTMRELQAADDDHPLKVDHKKPVDETSVTSPQIQELTKDLESVAIDWKTLRNITECSCSTPFDHFSRKVSKFETIISEIVTLCLLKFAYLSVLPKKKKKKL